MSGSYSRARIYGHFGFEKMIYHDDQAGSTDFTVPVKHFGTNVDDSTVFDQIVYEIKNSDRPGLSPHNNYAESSAIQSGRGSRRRIWKLPDMDTSFQRGIEGNFSLSSRRSMSRHLYFS